MLNDHQQSNPKLNYAYTAIIIPSWTHPTNIPKKVAARIQPPSTETEVYANGRENVAYHKNDDESTSEITTKEPSVDSISKSDSYRHVFKGDSLPGDFKAFNGYFIHNEWIVSFL